ncbi:serine hydrolase domain-containing protein [Thermodesulfobacteriota bacterium]
MKRKIQIALMVALSLLLATFPMFSCKKESSKPSLYKVPEQTNDGWETAHANEVNLDEQLLSELVQNISNEEYHDIHSVLIVKDGKLVFEEYFSGKDYREYTEMNYSRDNIHQVMSVTKSFASALIGIAIDRGMIKDTDEDLASLFPEYSQSFGEKGRKIKLKHLLSMTAGFDWDEITYLYSDSRNPYWIMLGPEKENIVRYILSRPITEEPGNKFTYNGGLSILLGKIIEKRSNLKTRDFAKKYLFEPLGIKEYDWGYWDLKEEVPKTDGGLSIRPRDMAKLGYLYANNGKWKGTQIVSEKWIEESTKKRITIDSYHLKGYGYQWWVYMFKIKGEEIEIPVASGWGGQGIYVFPDHDLIVVFTAGNHSLPHSQVFSMMYKMVNDYVLPSLS